MNAALISKKHLLVLVTALLAEALQHAATTPARAKGFDFLVILLVVVIFLAVFEDPVQRTVGLALGFAGVGTNWLHYVLLGRALLTSEVLHHIFMAGFFGFTAYAILRGIFQRKHVNGDAVIGAVCGYLFAGAAFGNLYALVELLSPGSFLINTAIAWQLNDWHQRRFLFDYLSLVTLTSLGYGEITPLLPWAQTLTWMESIFGQFYLAVVVAQLVGMRMAPKPHEAPPRAEKQA